MKIPWFLDPEWFYESNYNRIYDQLTTTEQLPEDHLPNGNPVDRMINNEYRFKRRLARCMVSLKAARIVLYGILTMILIQQIMIAILFFKVTQ